MATSPDAAIHGHGAFILERRLRSCRWPRMRAPGPVPPELMIACFATAGFVVSIFYGVDWSRLF
jgi:hypothetical protein